MKTKLAVLLSLGVIACQGANGTGTAPMTEVWSGDDAYDDLSVRDGLVYAEIPGYGVVSCAVTGCGDAPSEVVASDAFVSADVSSPIAYVAEVTALLGSGGELHVVDDGGDRTLASSLDHPSLVASAAGRTFVAEDSFGIDEKPATIDCVGCTTDGKVTPWISGFGGAAYGMFADASNVYVLTDDPSLSSVMLIACSVSHPCFSEPRVLLQGLDARITSRQITSDGASVYVAREALSDVVRVDSSGAVTTVVSSTDVTALAYDAASGTLYYGSATGDVMRIKPGTGEQPVLLGLGGDAIHAIALDETSVYVLTGESASIVMKTAK
jgi:hypothetical protein